MGSQIIIRMDAGTKKKFYDLARMEGKTASSKVREMVEEYIRSADISAVVDDLWDRVGARMKANKVSQADITRAVRAVRRAR